MMLLFLFNACKTTSIIEAGNDPNFLIQANEDGILKCYNRKVVVFGIPIYAVKAVEDERLLHAANILAQYLDNDEDGQVDNPAVLDAMLMNNAFLVMWKRSSDLNVDIPENAIGQDLGNNETIIDWHRNGQQGRFDAALEEVWHLITHAGYSKVYPNIFGEFAGTEIANAMDIARAGHFTNVPASYPPEAWYSYDDQSCDYSCMVTEYFYWGMSSLLGAQVNRQDEIQQEWRLHRPALFQQQDSALYDLLTDSSYHFPTLLPDGTYRH